MRRSPEPPAPPRGVGLRWRRTQPPPLPWRRACAPLGRLWWCSRMGTLRSMCATRWHVQWPRGCAWWCCTTLPAGSAWRPSWTRPRRWRTLQWLRARGCATWTVMALQSLKRAHWWALLFPFTVMHGWWGRRRPRLRRRLLWAQRLLWPRCPPPHRSCPLRCARCGPRQVAVTRLLLLRVMRHCRRSTLQRRQGGRAGHGHWWWRCCPQGAGRTLQRLR